MTNYILYGHDGDKQCRFPFYAPDREMAINMANAVIRQEDLVYYQLYWSEGWDTYLVMKSEVKYGEV